jgi:hypothetical protein
MGEHARSLAVPDATDRIVRLIEEIAGAGANLQRAGRAA